MTLPLTVAAMGSNANSYINDRATALLLSRRRLVLKVWSTPSNEPCELDPFVGDPLATIQLIDAPEDITLGPESSGLAPGTSLGAFLWVLF